MKARPLYTVAGLTLMALTWALPSSGGMSSPSYRILTHVIDNGGSMGFSGGFINLGAMGQSTPIGHSSAAGYINQAGFIGQIASWVGPCWDVDGDGYADEACGGTDCDDLDPLVNPDVDEVCDNGIDDDCDELVDYYDLDCFVYSLEVDASYVSGYLSLNFTIGTPGPATWVAYLIMIYPTMQVIPLWTIPLPVIWPPIDLPLSFPFPSVGWIALYTCLYPAEGEPICRIIWVST